MSAAPASPDLSREIERLGPWFHNLHLPDGTQTAPDHWLGDFPRFKWEQVREAIPSDLSGWSALDIGCNAGFYTFELAKRGAEVVGIDHDPRYLAQAEWAAPRFGLEERVRFERRQVYDLARSGERFDLVLFMGVFYHLRYPLLGLDAVAGATRRLLIFQTLTMPGEEVFDDVGDRPIEEREVFLEPGWPKMAFVERRFAGDPTNWWVPNHAAVLALLRSAGLEVVERPGHEIYACRPSGERPRRDGEELAAALGTRIDRPSEG